MNLKLGRIIIDDKYTGDEYFKDKNKKVVTLSPEYTEDTFQPTLIVGWYKVQEIFGDEVSILNKRISQNVFWTFSPNEKLQHFNEDIKKYLLILHEDIFQKYNYTFIDPIIKNIKSVSDIVNIIDNGKIDCIYITDDFIYIYTNRTRTILGIDIVYYQILNINVDKLKTGLIELSNTVLIEDYSENGVYNTYKNHFETDFDKKYIPLLETKKS